MVPAMLPPSGQAPSPASPEELKEIVPESAIGARFHEVDLPAPQRLTRLCDSLVPPPYPGPARPRGIGVQPYAAAGLRIARRQKPHPSGQDFVQRVDRPHRDQIV